MNPSQMPSISERFRGYEAAMADAGLAARPALVVGNTTERGFIRSPDFFTQLEHQMVDTIAAFLRGPERPQAIVAMNDLYALLVFEAARREGIAIPDDLAVVGFDDLDFTASLNPPLTTVMQEPFRLGAERRSCCSPAFVATARPRDSSADPGDCPQFEYQSTPRSD